MSKKVARVGDAVPYICIRGDDVITGTGSIITGSPDVRSDGASVARDGDSADCGLCGMGTVQATGQNNVNGRRIATFGDQVQIAGGNAYIATASQRTSTK